MSTTIAITVGGGDGGDGGDDDGAAADVLYISVNTHFSAAAIASDCFHLAKSTKCQQHAIISSIEQQEQQQSPLFVVTLVFLRFSFSSFSLSLLSLILLTCESF